MINLLSRPTLIGLVLITTLLAMPTTSVANGVWTLESSIKRALEIAPELQSSAADVAAREGAYRAVDAWPNPTVGAAVSNKLGLEDDTGGTDLTQMELRQPLPLRRLSRERAVASAEIEAARERARYERLKLTREVARVFHRLQLARTKRKLAEERVTLADTAVTGRDRLVRYIAPADRERLNVLREQARQGLRSAQAEEERAAIEFRALLALPSKSEVETTLASSPPVPALEELERNLDNHPQLAGARRETEAAQAGVAAAQSRRFNDPELTLFRERDYVNGARRNVNGVGISVQVPLWNTNSGPSAQAYAQAQQAQAREQIAARDTRVRLAQAYAEAVRLREQVKSYEDGLLAPTNRVLTLTQRSFAAGEVNVLALVDALNTYYETGTRYRELQTESAEALAELRLAAGVEGEKQ